MIASGFCSYHPDRPGLGVCVECRKVICVECTTQFEGINRCASCLQKKLAAAKTVPVRREWTFGNVFLAMCAMAGIFGVLYLTASVLQR